MLRALLADGVLTCPSCRGWQDGAFHNAPLEEHSAAEERGGRLWQGFLACSRCRQRYPVLDGVAIVLKEIGPWVRQQERALMWRGDLAPELSRWLHGAWGDDEDPNWRRQMLAVYARDPEEGPLGALASKSRAQLHGRLAAGLRQATAPRVLDAGCGVGQSALMASALGAEVLAMDLDFGPLRLLSHLLLEGEVGVPRWRHGGGDFQHDHRLALPERAAPERVALVVGDAQDPPLAAKRFDVTLGLNVLDNVSSPVQLVRQLHASVRVGGRLLLTSPYDWSDRATPRAERLGEGVKFQGSDDPAEALRALLRGDMPELAPELHAELTWDEEALPWVLQRHERSAHVFFVHALEAARREETPTGAL